MRAAVLALGFGIFAQGTSELMLTGLVPLISSDLDVSIPRAGLLISAFAVGMLVGAPVMAVSTLRLPRRTTLLGFVAVFIVAHVASALAPSYDFLLVTRVVAAVTYAGFWAVAQVTVLSLVPVERRARAMGVVAGGLTVAMVAGLPMGTLIGDWLGWRAAFWLVAGLSTVALVVIAVTVPSTGAEPGSGDAPRVANELRSMRTPRLWLAYSTNALVTSASLVTFGYLAPILIHVTGLSSGTVPIVLAIYGLGTFAGITLAGRTTDARPTGTLLTSLALFAVVSAALALSLHQPALVIPLVGVLGAATFAGNPALNTQVFSLAECSPTLATAVNVSAFNVGITVGPALGGALLGAGFGYPVLTWASVVFALLAFGTAAAVQRPSTSSEPDPERSGAEADMSEHVGTGAR